MAKSYVEQLTIEQIEQFLDTQYPEQQGYSYNFFRLNGSIRVHVEQNSDECSFNFSLREYETDYCNRHKQWIKYLYEVFGEEYKQAYLEYFARIFD